MGSTVETQPPKQATDVPMLLAVSYLRVSTREQAERGGTDEGFSIPAQREANGRKAAELGARIVREFIDCQWPRVLDHWWPAKVTGGGHGI